MEPAMALRILIPDQAAILLLMLAGFSIMLRLRYLTGILISAVVGIAIFRPFVRGVLADMPEWLMLPLAIVVGIAFFRGAMGLLLGKDAANILVGNLATDVVCWLIMAPFRVLRAIFGR